MQLNFSQIVTLLGFVSAVQAGGNPYSRKATKERQQTAQVQQINERPNGRQVSNNQARQGKQPNLPNTRQVGKPAAGGAIYGRKDVYKGGKPKANYEVQQAKAAGQFGPVIRPGVGNADPEDRPGFAWQQRTITVTVTRGFARTTVTRSTDVTRTFTDTITSGYESTITETTYVTEDATSTNFVTETATETVVTSIGPFSTIEETSTIDFVPTETTTTVVENATTITEPTTVTAWETNVSTEIEYSPVTTTNEIPFSTTTIITPLTTVFETVQGDVVTLTVTEPVQVTAYTTVQDVFTATEIEITYETPAYMLY